MEVFIGKYCQNVWKYHQIKIAIVIIVSEQFLDFKQKWYITINKIGDSCGKTNETNLRFNIILPNNLYLYHLEFEHDNQAQVCFLVKNLVDIK